MTENTKTGIFVVLAAVLLVAAWIVRPKEHQPPSEESVVGTVLFSDLKSPSAVKGLRIVTYDEQQGRAKPFKVVQASGGWRLPSNSDYPADAEKQVADAATALIDLKVLSVKSANPSEHAEYGVLDPEKAEPGASGVGKLVEVLDSSDNSLARLIIGKEDQGTSQSGSREKQLRFVRQPGHDAVYVVEIPADKYSTRFQDWIETDLLKLDSWDVSRVTLRDYSSFTEPDFASGRLAIERDRKSKISVRFDDKESKWSLEELTLYENDEPKQVQLGEDEELNSTRLNDLKTALDDLKIVDVRRKPEGMSGNLKANKSIFSDRQAFQSLIERGFYPVPGEDGEPEISSSDGDVEVEMKDGVEYLLRFGKVAGIGGSDEEKKDDQKKADEATKQNDGKDSGANLNRFIMVSARFNKDKIPAPTLEPLPEAPTKKEAAEEGGENGDKKDDAADAQKTDADKSEAKTVITKKVQADETAAKDKTGGSDADAKSDNAEKEDKKLSAEEQEELALERKRVEKENERKQKEYDEKVKKGQDKAKELNDRFADWYYVVSEETYRKIHLERDDVIKKKTPEKKDGDSAAGATDPFSKRSDLDVPGLDTKAPAPGDADATAGDNAAKEGQEKAGSPKSEENATGKESKSPAADGGSAGKKGESAKPAEKTDKAAKGSPDSAKKSSDGKSKSKKAPTSGSQSDAPKKEKAARRGG